MTGSKTTNLPALAAVDELIGNDLSVWPGNSGRIAIDALALQLAASPAIGIGVNSGIKIFDTYANMDLDLLPEPGFGAWVMNDPDPANNWVWAKTGASGAAGWEKRGPLPYNIIQMYNAGTGTGGAIQATTAVGVPSTAFGAIFVLNITHDNPDGITLSVNGETPKNLTTISGVTIPFGTLLAGDAHLVVNAGPTYQLLTEGNMYKTVVELINVGAGTANDIQVTTESGVPSDAKKAIYTIGFVVPNTGPVTVSGAINRPVVTNTGAAIPAGYFTAGMLALCIDDGTSLRLLSYGDASAVQAAAEAAAAQALVHQQNASTYNPDHWFGTVGSCLADATTYATFSAGDIVYAGLHTFLVADALATDHTSVNAGGVKMYALATTANEVDIIQIGAVSGAADITAEFVDLCEYCADNGYTAVTGNGLWNITLVLPVFLNGDLKLVNRGTIHTSGVGRITFNAGGYIQQTLTADITRGDLTIDLVDASGVVVGGSFDLYDTSVVVETSWSYYSGESHTVVDVVGNTIHLDRKTDWGYVGANPAFSLRTHPEYNIHVSGGKWIMDTPGSNFAFFNLTFTIENLDKSTTDENSDNVWGMDASGCKGYYHNIKQAGFSYGLLLNRCRDVHGFRVVARNLRHSIDPSLWSINTVLEDIIGDHCQTIISSHPSINTSFININTTNETDAFKPRCMGMTIINCKIHSVANTSSYGSRVILVDPSIWDEFEINIDGLIMDTPNAVGDGRVFTAILGGRLTARNIVASHVQIGGERSEFYRLSHRVPKKRVTQYAG